MLEAILESARLSAAELALVPIALLIFVGVFTPGPNNIMLVLSGSRVGFRKTLPHMAGITVGFTILIVLQGVVYTKIFNAFPWTHTALRIFFSAFLLWLAYKIASADPNPQKAEKKALLFPLPFGFVRAVLFQAINPKAWSIAGAVLTNYGPATSGRLFEESLLIGAVAVPISAFSTITWTSIGTSLRSWLAEPGRARIFNRVMAGGLVLALGAAWF